MLHLTKQEHLDSDGCAAGGVADGSVEDTVGTGQLFEDTTSSGLLMTDSAIRGLTRLLLLVDDFADHEALADGRGEIENKPPPVERKYASQLRYRGLR